MVIIPALIISYFLKGHTAVIGILSVISLILLGLELLIGSAVTLGTVAYAKKRSEFLNDRDYIWDLTARCDTDLDREKRRVKKFFVFDAVWFYFCAVSQCLLTASAFLSTRVYFIIPAIIFTVLTVTYRTVGADNVEPGAPITKDEFPEIFGLVEELSKKYAPDCKILPYAIHGPYLLNQIYNNKYALCIGITAMGLLSKSQLRAALTHEILHIKNGDTDLLYSVVCAQRRARKGSGDNKLKPHVLGFMMGPALLLAFMSASFIVAASRTIEHRIDLEFADVSDYEQKRAYVGAIATLRCFNQYLAEGHDEMFILDAPEPVPDFESYSERMFRATLVDREDFWREYLEKEIVTKNSKYFPFSYRREALGVNKDDLDIAPSEQDYSWIKEVDEMKRYSDEMIFQGLSINFFAEKQEYTNYLRHYEEGSKRLREGEEMSLTEMLELATSAEGANLHDEAKRIYDLILEKYPKNANALYRRGSYYLVEYDEKGIDMIWKAIDDNSNYIKSGISLLNAFCANMGLADRLDEVRERSVELLGKKSKSYSKLFDLRSGGEFTLPDLPKELINEIVEFVKNECGDNLDELYIAKKTADGIDCTMIFISPTPETRIVDWQKAYHNIFMFLDVKEEQFLLDTFKDEPPYIKKLKKLKGALIFKRDTTKKNK
ncbi:MAG: hypothetical protein IKA82_00155 [Clostridia bacterium]|nr:hypothetical protein [Clostridia bacterium]